MLYLQMTRINEINLFFGPEKEIDVKTQCMMMMPLNEAFYLDTLANTTNLNGFIQLDHRPSSLRLPPREKRPALIAFMKFHLTFEWGFVTLHS